MSRRRHRAQHGPRTGVVAARSSGSAQPAWPRFGRAAPATEKQSSARTRRPVRLAVGQRDERCRHHPRQARRLLFVGWEGADWKIITPLLDRGQLPNLSALVARGVMGRLSSLSPLLSPLLWTLIATGKRADRHGVLAASEFDDTLGVFRPVGRGSLKTATVWDILRHQGLQGHVIDWPASHPARSIDDIAISDWFAAATSPVHHPWPLPPGSVSPARLEATFETLRLHPGEIPGDALLPFIPRLAEIDQSHDPRVVGLPKAWHGPRRCTRRRPGRFRTRALGFRGRAL